MTGISEDVIQEILRAKFGTLLDWRVPEIVPTVGPYEPAVFHKFDDRRSALISRCQETLSGYSDETLRLILLHPRDNLAGALTEWQDFLSAEIRILQRNVPPWYAGGFGHPDYVADFDYWAKMPTFRLEELLCLSVGIEPRHFPKKKIEDLNKREFDTLWPPLQFLLRRHEQFLRQFDPHSLRWKVQPARFIAWARDIELDVHHEFMALLEKYHPINMKEPEQAREIGRTDKREVDTIAKLFTAMAIQEYGYDPTQRRSPIPGEIADIMASLGLSVSEDTIRKYLRLGASSLPKGWKPNSN